MVENGESAALRRSWLTCLSTAIVATGKELEDAARKD